MKLLAVLMVIIGVVMGWGAVMEFSVYGPSDIPFWVGAIAAPAGFGFVFAGILLWFRGRSVRHLVLLSGLAMGVTTIVGSAFSVMGISATIIGLTGALAAVVWSLRNRMLAT